LEQIAAKIAQKSNTKNKIFGENAAKIVLFEKKKFLILLDFRKKNKQYFA
jgi:hypothetical protein